MEKNQLLEVANSSMFLEEVPFQREMSKLLDSKLVKQVKIVGNAKMYKLNKPHKHSQQKILYLRYLKNR